MSATLPARLNDFPPERPCRAGSRLGGLPTELPWRIYNITENLKVVKEKMTTFK